MCIETLLLFTFIDCANLLCQEVDDASPFAREVEGDESYFSGARKGKRSRGAAGKV